LTQNAAILTEEEASQTLVLVNALETATQGEDKDLIHQRMEELNEYTTPLAHRALDANIAEAMKGKKL
jgi:molecular chaperone HscA